MGDTANLLAAMSTSRTIAQTHWPTIRQRLPEPYRHMEWQSIEGIETERSRDWDRVNHIDALVCHDFDSLMVSSRVQAPEHAGYDTITLRRSEVEYLWTQDGKKAQLHVQFYADFEDCHLVILADLRQLVANVTRSEVGELPGSWWQVNRYDDRQFVVMKSKFLREHGALIARLDKPTIDGTFTGQMTLL